MYVVLLSCHGVVLLSLVVVSGAQGAKQLLVASVSWDGSVRMAVMALAMGAAGKRPE